MSEERVALLQKRGSVHEYKIDAKFNVPEMLCWRFFQFLHRFPLDTTKANGQNEMKRRPWQCIPLKALTVLSLCSRLTTLDDWNVFYYNTDCWQIHGTHQHKKCRLWWQVTSRNSSFMEGGNEENKVAGTVTALTGCWWMCWLYYGWIRPFEVIIQYNALVWKSPAERKTCAANEVELFFYSMCQGFRGRPAQWNVASD